MQFNKPDEKEGFCLTAEPDVQADGGVIYRSGMNPKIHRNFEIFTPCDFIAAITQHIPDNGSLTRTRRSSGRQVENTSAARHKWLPQHKVRNILGTTYANG